MATTKIPVSEMPPSLVDQAPKLAEFIALDINDAKFQDLKIVPQLGEKAEEHLEQAGITNVKQLIGMFLVKQNKEEFQKWLEGVGLASGENSFAAKVAIVINNYCADNGL